MPGTFDEFEKSLDLVKAKAATLADAENKATLARADYDKAVIKATEIRTKIDEMLNSLIPSNQGRIRVAS